MNKKEDEVSKAAKCLSLIDVSQQRYSQVYVLSSKTIFLAIKK